MSQPPRAVIDIGSNTVRLVIYEGTARAPEPVWNEKVAARLGRDLSKSGYIPEDAAFEALAALARYRLLLDDLAVEDVQTVATAAVRDATNGQDFLTRVAALGFAPQLLTGEEEARASAFGAIGAFPDACGSVADLGGGSLELVEIAQGSCHKAISLPFGTLRLEAMSGRADLGTALRSSLGALHTTAQRGQLLYMIGGTWRALAHYVMAQTNYPLTDPHGFLLERKEARGHCKALIRTKPSDLVHIASISAMRASYLPKAAALLLALLDETKPSHLVFSSWGLREGLLFARLSPSQRAVDPLLAAVNAFAQTRDASVTHATRIVGWTACLSSGTGPRTERLRLAAAQLAAALQRVEPNLRPDLATGWALDKRWIDCTPHDRALLCAALHGSLGSASLPDRIQTLAPERDTKHALVWGYGFRLARRLGAGSIAALANSSLVLEDQTIALHLESSRAPLATSLVQRELARVADALGREPVVRIN